MGERGERGARGDERANLVTWAALPNSEMSMADDTTVIVTVEGGIGVGKSTVMDALRAARPSLLFIDEPVATWEETGLLDAMYKKTIPSGTFQIAALATRMAPILKAVREGHRLIVTERCPWSDFEVFTKANLAGGSIELAAYKMAYDALMTAMPDNVSLCNLYLAAQVPTLEKRIAWRARDAERTETPAARTARSEYLGVLQDRQDAFAVMTAKELGVQRYVTKQINAEEGAVAVAQKAEYALSCMAPVKLESAVAPSKRARGEGAD